MAFHHLAILLLLSSPRSPFMPAHLPSSRCWARRFPPARRRTSSRGIWTGWQRKRL